MTATAAALPLRGPLLVGTVLLSLSLPTLLRLAPHTLVCLAFLGIGLCLTVHDSLFYCRNQVRTILGRRLGTLVLDDLLRDIFDPTTGYIACFVSTLLGNASMYSLNMTTEQRVRLLNSCLWTTPEHAEAILMEPGGVIKLLPLTLQHWLQPPLSENQQQEKDMIEEKQINETDNPQGDEESSEDGSEQSVTAAQAVGETDESETTQQTTAQVTARGLPRPRTGVETPPISGAANVEAPSTNRTLPPRRVVHQEDPLEIMGVIVKDILRRHLQRAVPSSAATLRAIGMTLVSLWVARQAPWRRSVAAVGVGVAAGTALASWTTSTQLTMPSLSIQVKSMLQRLASSAQGQRWKATIAMVILWYIGHRRQRTSSSPPARR